MQIKRGHSQIVNQNWDTRNRETNQGWSNRLSRRNWMEKQKNAKQRIINRRIGSEDGNGKEIYRKRRERERAKHTLRRREICLGRRRRQISSLCDKEKRMEVVSEEGLRWFIELGQRSKVPLRRRLFGPFRISVYHSKLVKLTHFFKIKINKNIRYFFHCMNYILKFPFLCLI